MPIQLTDKFIFRGIIIYLPFSIFFLFWIYLVAIVYESDVWQYQLFYGKDGNIALLWLFVVLLPALLFLISKARGKVLLLSRFFGAAGFYCLLGSLISSHSNLALAGFILLFISIVINRRLKKQALLKEGSDK